MFEEARRSGGDGLTPQEQSIELRFMIQELEVTSKVFFDHADNYWTNHHGGHVFRPQL